MNIFYIWKQRGKILEGVTNSIFKREDVEEIATERLIICRSGICGFHDPNGTSEAAYIKGVESCGHCGCKLSWKCRALSDKCPTGHWEAVMTGSEEEALKQKLGITDEQ